MCSTPFGIRDQISAHILCVIFCLCVLNAFRHQRSNQIGRPLLRWIATSAQRLSASEISLSASEIKSAALSEAGTAYPLGAQRLSASEIKSGIFVLLNIATKKCSTPFGIRDQISRTSIKVKLEPLQCSTPFGIRDQISKTIFYTNLLT
ncbi:MAG: hypothetical protein PWR24_1486 [Desulfonauticus sp.]|nr:hypothetical protein [Desulfonauticus sp.]